MQKMHDLLGRVSPDGLVTFVAMAEVRSFNYVYQGRSWILPWVDTVLNSLITDVIHR